MTPIRHVLSKVRHRLARRRRARRDPASIRDRGLSEEVDFWRKWFATRGMQWTEEYEYRVDPEAEVRDAALREVLEDLQGPEVSILDVGAGPLTMVGQRLAGKTLHITAVDPLAHEYDRLIDEAGVTPPVRTQQVEGERVLERFGPNAFDVAYARNAIDHVVDPRAVIENMVAVVRPGGYVVLRHARNEALNHDYKQLHQWNFDERDGRFFIWREQGHATDMTRALANRANVSCRVEHTDNEWVVAILRIRGDGGLDAR